MVFFSRSNGAMVVMGGINRKQFVFGMSAAGLVSMTSAPGMAAAVPALTQINPDWLVSEEEAFAWHKVKDSKGPALTGNKSWHNFLQFLEVKLKEYGCVDVHRSPWTFDRIETSYWPDDSKWSLGAFSQITGFFMASDLADLQAPKVERAQQNFGPLR